MRNSLVLGSAGVMGGLLATVVFGVTGGGGGDQPERPGLEASDTASSDTSSGGGALASGAAGADSDTAAAPDPASPTADVVLTVSKQPYALPPGSILYFFESCAVCGNGGELYRFAQDRDGRWQREPILTGGEAELPLGWPLSPVVTDGGRRLAVLWCLREFGFCGKRHDGSVDDVPRALLVSDDGGATWRDVGRVPPLVTLQRFEGDEFLGVHNLWPELAREYRLYPSGTPYEMPQSAKKWTVPGAASGVFVEVSHGVPRQLDDRLTITVENKPDVGHYVFQRGHIAPTLVLSSTLILGWADWQAPYDATGTPLPEFFRLPVAIDLVTRTVAPIAGLEPLPHSAIVTPLLLLRADSWAIVRAEPCLNVRAAPALSAAILHCEADGALIALRPTGEREAGWTAVYTRAGRPAWVASEYLAGRR